MKLRLTVVLLVATATALAQDKDQAARTEALLRAGRRPDASDVAAIGTRLDDPDPLLAAAALRVLRDRAGLVTAPGTEAERAAVEAALLQLAAPAAGRSARTRAEALRLLATVASSDTAALGLVGWLGDADPLVADAAEFALARSGGCAASWRALTQLLATDKGVAADRAARLLAREPAQLTPEQLRLVAARNRDRLAASGELRMEGELRLALTSGTPGALAHWLEHLHARAAMDAAGREFAVRELRQLLGDRDPATRRAGLAGVIELAPETLADILFDRLSDPDARVAALAATTLAERASQRGELLLRLRGALAGATPRARAGLLRILSDLDPEHTRAQVLLAAGGDEPLARTAALELLGRSDDPGSLALLRQAGQQAGTAWQDTALRSLLATAGRRARAGQRALAQELCHEVLQGSARPELRLAALAELRNVADEGTLARLTPFLATPELREDVVQVQLALARRMPGDRKVQALEVLKTAHDLSTSADTRRQILVQMGKLGADVAAYATRNGCVLEWRILGPAGKCEGKALGEQPFGANGPDLDQPVTIDGRTLRWQTRRTKDPGGVVDLTFLDPRQDTSAFALADLDWPRDEAVQLKIGSDDGVAVWVNGERVHLHDVARGLEVDGDTVPCRFRTGRNRVLVRISQGGGDWGFCVRVTDGKGNGIDLTHGH